MKKWAWAIALTVLWGVIALYVAYCAGYLAGQTQGLKDGEQISAAVKP